MIYIKQISDIKTGDYDEVWAIVQSIKNTGKMMQVADLSPSKELFFQYRKLVKEGKWGEQAFQEIYVPQFIHELSGNKRAKDCLNRLYALDKMEKNICLACFCKEEELCHRSIIAGLLQGVGCNVITENMAVYTKYYKMYREYA